MATANRLTRSPVVHRLVINPFVFRLTFTSFATTRFAKAIIDQNVLRGNEKYAPRKHERLSQHGSAIPRTFARYASDMTDWAFNGAVRGGEYTYRVYSFTKD
jgi:hypothetical protein